MTDNLKLKIDASIKLIQSAGLMAEEHGQPLEVCYSGGKDSDVVLWLVQMAGVKYRAIYKNTTIDPPGTIAHCKSKDVEIVQPKMTFAQLIAKKGIPSRTVRFCCDVLKEYKILDYAVLGVRRDESSKRAKLYREPEMCRVYNSKEKCRLYYPILYWTLSDVKEFIVENGIKCAPVYYDEQGVFHAENRLGCMCCPMQARRKRIDSFLSYPNMLRLYCRNLDIYRLSHPNSSNIKKYETVYDFMLFSLFCNSMEEFRLKFGKNLFFPKIDSKKFLEDYFSVDLDI